MQNSLYELLEVSPRARLAVIKAAYRCLVQQYHPDKKNGPSHPHEQNTHEQVALINHAYSVLSDPQRRAQYDQTLAPDGQIERRGQRAPKSPGPRNGSSKTRLRPFVFRPFE